MKTATARNGLLLLFSGQVIGTVTPTGDHGEVEPCVEIRVTNDRAEAERWIACLQAGRIPPA